MQCDLYAPLFQNNYFYGGKLMLHNITEESWKKAIQGDSKLKELATKAGVENNYQRVVELNGCFAFNFGRSVTKSNEERQLAMYMFCIDDSDSLKNTLQERMAVAQAAGIQMNDL